jgi:predicted dithiol-disulfide oxidoreductase (DUF899 family)
VAIYLRSPDEARYRPLALSVLHVDGGRVVEVIDWSRPELFEAFGLPMSFPASDRSNEGRGQRQGGRMKVGTEQEWQAARKELLAAERELEEHAKRVEEQRGELPWVPVEKDYSFATEAGSKPLPELFEGRSLLLIYHLMFGADWAVACPGCSSLADGLGGVVVHLNDRDVTLLCMSQAPLEQLVAYKRRRGWTVPYVSAHGGDFLFDYGYAFRRDEMSGVVREEFDMGQLLREAPQLPRGRWGAGPRVRRVRERGVERVREPRRRHLQHLPRVSAFAPHHAAVLRAARAAAEQGMNLRNVHWIKAPARARVSPFRGSAQAAEIALYQVPIPETAPRGTRALSPTGGRRPAGGAAKQESIRPTATPRRHAPEPAAYAARRAPRAGGSRRRAGTRR